MEGATHSHVLRALAARATAKEIRHFAVLAISTLALPTTIMAKTRVDDVLKGERCGRALWHVQWRCCKFSLDMAGRRYYPMTIRS